jgi:hypothetical protein
MRKIPVATVFERASTGDPHSSRQGSSAPEPGTVFAEASRACPVNGSFDALQQGVPCVPETCSYFSGIHVKYPLQLDCLDSKDFSTCVGYCAPRPIP